MKSARQKRETLKASAERQRLLAECSEEEHQKCYNQKSTTQPVTVTHTHTQEMILLFAILKCLLKSFFHATTV